MFSGPILGKIIMKNHEILTKKYGRLSRYVMIFFLSVLLCFGTVEVDAQRDFEKEEKIGRKIADKIEKQYELIEDPENLDKVRKIGEMLKNVSDWSEIHYQFAIIDREGPNAFALPGGFIYLTSDLFDYIHSDDELAAVIAHEMGHIIHQHSIKQMKDNQKLKLVEMLTILLTGDPNLGLLSELTSITLLNSYRREYEEEADLTALQLLNRSDCYHPVALLTYFERVSSEDLLKPGQDLGIFQTHPDINERIQKVKQYLQENGIEVNRRLTTNYLTVNGELQKQDKEIIARIFINQEEIFSFTGKEEETIYQKMEEVIYRLDQSLRIDLEPYEITLYSIEEQSTLRIGNEKIISLSQKEVDFQGLTVSEILEQARIRISKILWKLKLKLPTLLVKDKLE